MPETKSEKPAVPGGVEIGVFYGLKSPYGRIIEVYSDPAKATQAAVRHEIYNGWEVEVIKVRVEEVE
ncbi:MAG: hypothetical protein DRO11_09205 [Methanobacteriota archaeon]|nr:MAG: hypothetical protein DRO11_09205 [Euryarchaeota archaeon]